MPAQAGIHDFLNLTPPPASSAIVDAGSRRQDEPRSTPKAGFAAALILAAIILILTAFLRGPEYDEAYSIFLTAGHARPTWPTGIFSPGAVRNLYAGHAGFRQIAHDLRSGDVHPPLYFWVLEMWRRVVGPSWFATRLLSVVCSIAALGALGRLAVLADVPVIPAILVALFAYGFADTGIVARGFALAQLLNVVGASCVFAAIRKRRQSSALAAGLAFGAASLTNYLAVFTGLAFLAWLTMRRIRCRYLPLASIGFAFFLPLDAWFFLAQRGARINQFAGFSWQHAIPLLAKDAGAAMFGGLPLYAGKYGIFVGLGLGVLAIVCGVFIARRWRPVFAPLTLAAAATPVGLLALGLIFHNTPIEIRYLAFSLPFIALLCAAALPRPLLLVLLSVEACAIVGLAVATATMQPQGRAAHAAAAFTVPDTLVLLPFGNDGVGVPGPFIAAAPNDLRIVLIGADQSGRRLAFPPGIPAGKWAATPAIPARNDGGALVFPDERRLVLIEIAADDASRQALADAASFFRQNPCWQLQQRTALLEVYLNRCAHQQP